MSKDKRKIRAIDSHTIYDVEAGLTKLSRNIRDGKWGAVSDVMILVRHCDDDGVTKTHAVHFGRGESATALMMLEVVKRDMMR